MLRLVLIFSALAGCCLGLAEFQGRQVCTGPDDCNPGECCVIPPYKNHPPRCWPLRARGQSCIPDGKSQTGEATYVGTLDNQSHIVSYTNTYKYLCPCQKELECLRLSRDNTGTEWPVGNIRDTGNCWSSSSK